MTRRFRRLRSGAARLGLLAAAAAGPGLGGVEAAAHLTGLVDFSHERRPHLEAAGASGHTDECQLLRPAPCARLISPAVRGPRIPPLRRPARPALAIHAVAAQRPNAVQARAPPA